MLKWFLIIYKYISDEKPIVKQYKENSLAWMNIYLTCFNSENLKSFCERLGKYMNLLCNHCYLVHFWRWWSKVNKMHKTEIWTGVGKFSIIWNGTLALFGNGSCEWKTSLPVVLGPSEQMSLCNNIVSLW